jgi:uncharacterized protein YndB with AHSA1/START domain
MSDPQKTIAFNFVRTIAAPPSEVFDAWLNPNVAGNPWNAADELLFTPKVDGFFRAVRRTAHYGCFTKLERPGRIQYTWVSPNTAGEESIITLTFEKREEGTLMTVVHSGLPDSEGGKIHESGWNRFLEAFSGQFAAARTQ